MGNLFDELFGEEGYTKISYDFDKEEVVVVPAKVEQVTVCGREDEETRGSR